MLINLLRDFVNQKRKIGEKVKAGQVIGCSGKVGWLANLANEPHLHFMVGRYDYKTLKVRFKDKL